MTDVSNDERDQRYAEAGASVATPVRSGWGGRMSMPTLTEFLLARIAEDETDAGGIECFGVDFLEMYKRRALAECEAMRAIVARHSEHLGLDRSEDYRNGCDTLRHLAAVYADHPDYDEAWRP